MKTRTCCVCGRKFVPITSNQRYCDSICSLKARKEQQRAYYQRSKRERHEYYMRTRDAQCARMREYHLRRSGGDVKTLTIDQAAKVAVAALTKDQRQGLRFLLGGLAAWLKWDEKE